MHEHFCCKNVVEIWIIIPLLKFMAERFKTALYWCRNRVGAQVRYQVFISITYPFLWGANLHDGQQLFDNSPKSAFKAQPVNMHRHFDVPFDFALGVARATKVTVGGVITSNLAAPPPLSSTSFSARICR